MKKWYLSFLAALTLAIGAQAEVYINGGSETTLVAEELDSLINSPASPMVTNAVGTSGPVNAVTVSNQTVHIQFGPGGGGGGGTSVYANVAGTSVWAYGSETANWANVAAYATNAGQAGTSTYANVAGTSVYAEASGTAGTSLYADVAGYVKMGVTYYVKTNGNDVSDGLTYATAKATISNALGVAVNGDVVVVGPGTYDITAELLATNAVTVKSSAGYAQTIIQRVGTQSNRIFTVSGIGAVVDGFTIANGIAPYDGITLQGNGGNVLVSNGGILRNCKVINGKAFQYGGGVFGEFYGSVENCIITNNIVTNEFGLAFVVGGGVFLYGDGAELSQFYLRRSLVAYNTVTGVGAGGGVALRYGNYVEQCTIVSNTVTTGFAGAYGGGILGLNNGGTVRDSVIYFNTPNNNEPTALGGAVDNTVTYSCMTPLHAGAGNTAADPSFVNPTNGNFALKSDSPCIGSGSQIASVMDMGYLAGQFKESDPVAWPYLQANVISNTIDKGVVARELGYYFNPVSTVTRPYTVPVLSDGNYAAAVGSYTVGGSVRFLNISNANSITEITNLFTPGGINSPGWATSCSNYIITVDNSGWVSVFDWSDRNSPSNAANIRPRASQGYEVLASDCGGYIFSTFNAAPNFAVTVSTNGLPTGLTNVYLGGSGDNRIGIVYDPTVHYPATWYLASNEVSNIASGKIVEAISPVFSNLVSWGAATSTYYMGSFVFTNYLAGANGSLAFIPGDTFRFIAYLRKSNASAPIIVRVRLESVDEGVTNTIAQSPEITLVNNVNINAITNFVTVSNYTVITATNIAISVYARNTTAIAQNLALHGGTNRASSVQRKATTVHVANYGTGNIETYKLSGTNVALIGTTFASPTVARLGAANNYLYSVTYQGTTLDVFSMAGVTNLAKVSSIRLRAPVSFYAKPTIIGNYMYISCGDANAAMHAYDITRPQNPGYAFAMGSTTFTNRAGGLGITPVLSRNMIVSIVGSNGSHRAIMLWENPSSRMLDTYLPPEYDPVFGLISNSIVTNLKANVSLGTNTTLLGKSTFTNGSYVWDILNPAIGGGSIVGPGGLSLSFVTGSDTMDARNAPITARATSGDLFRWVSSGGATLGSINYLGVMTGNGSGISNVNATYATSAGSAGSATTADTAGTSLFARTAFNVTEAYSLQAQRYYVSTGFGTAAFNTNWYWIGTYEAGYKEYRDANNLRKITHSEDPGGSWVMRSVAGAGSPVYDTAATTNDIDMVVWQVSDLGDAPAGSLSNNTVNVQPAVHGSLLPGISNTYDLGSASLPFRDIYVSSNSIKYVGTGGVVVATLSADTVASLTGSSTNLVPLTSANPTGDNNVVTLGYLNSNGVGAAANNNFTGSTNTFKTIVVTNFIQTAGGWDDLVTDANNIRVQGTVNVTANYVSNSVDFTTGATTNFADDHVYFTMQIPHSWKTNTAIFPHLHFVQTAANQTNNMWFMRYKWYSLGDAVPTVWTEINSGSNAFTYVSGSIHQIAELPSVGINGAGKSISSLLDIKIYRRGTIGTGTVQMKQFDIHIQKDSLGSDGIVDKSF
jgi:hypothetical protein